MSPVFTAALCAVLVSHVPDLVAQTHWTLATGYRAELFHTENIAQFAREVESTSRQQLRIDVLPNGSLFKLADIRQAVQSGQADAGEAIMSGMAPALPLAGADAVPFVVGSYQDALRLWQLQRPVLERQMGQHGLKPLYAVPWPPQGLYAVRAIKSVADFKNLKMRTYNPTSVRIAELLGAQPVDLPTADIAAAVQDGRVETMITSAVTGVDSQAWSGMHVYYEINAWFPKNLVFVNAQRFAALGPALQNQVLQASAEAERRGWARSEAEARKATLTLQSKGIRLERLPAEVEHELQRMGERFSREWVRSTGNDASAIFVPYYFN